MTGGPYLRIQLVRHGVEDKLVQLHDGPSRHGHEGLVLWVQQADLVVPDPEAAKHAPLGSGGGGEGGGGSGEKEEGEDGGEGRERGGRRERGGG